MSALKNPAYSLIAYARAVEGSRAAGGQWPYPWIFEDSNSQHVRAAGSIVTPALATPTTIMSFTVPDGFRFSLRGVVVTPFVNGFVDGDGSLTFTLSVSTGAGLRNVEFFTGVTTSLGSPTHGPFPVHGRLEFDPLDTLIWQVNNVSADVGTVNRVVAMLIGHIYPNAEVAGR